MKLEGDLLKSAIKLAGYTQLEFAHLLGVSRATINNLTKQAYIGDEYKVKTIEILKLPKHYFDTNDTNATNDKSYIVNDVTPVYKSKIKSIHLPETSIPVYNDGGSAGHAQLYDDFKERPQAYIRVPGYEDCDFATYAYGHSMYPIIENGCLILCRKTQGKQMILWGEIYYIITQDYRLVKRLQKSADKRNVKGVSENDEKRRDGDLKFEPIEIPLDDIRELYLVKGIIKKIQI